MCPLIQLYKSSWIYRLLSIYSHIQLSKKAVCLKSAPLKGLSDHAQSRGYQEASPNGPKNSINWQRIHHLIKLNDIAQWCLLVRTKDPAVISDSLIFRCRFYLHKKVWIFRSELRYDYVLKRFKPLGLSGSVSAGTKVPIQIK